MARYKVQTATGAKRKALYGKTRGEVSEKLTKAMAARDGGFVFDAGKQTVGEYLARWLSNSVRGTVHQRTYERCESPLEIWWCNLDAQHRARAIDKLALQDG